MRDVVVIGGGLTGLSAAYELSQHALDVTLIEVKRHLGGSIQTIEQNNCIFDSAAFAIQESLDTTWLESLGLGDTLFSLRDDCVAFKEGTSTLIKALQEKISATRLMRMAVSSIGELDDGRYSICMENGLMFDAKALILAIPARYAERMFYGYITPLTERLLDYHYDTVLRVSVVCPTDETPQKISPPPDMAYLFVHRTTHPARVPDAYTLLQFGIRLDPNRLSSTETLVDFVCERFDLPKPMAAHVSFWAESDPISRFDDDHAEWVASLRKQLPDGIALVGSDYNMQAACGRGIVDLNERIQQGIDAARQMVRQL